MSFLKNTQPELIQSNEQLKSKQWSLLNSCFIKASLGYLAIALISTLISFLFTKYCADWTVERFMPILYTGIVLIFAAAIIGSFWTAGFSKKSMFSTLFVWIFFIMAESLGFGTVFFLLQMADWGMGSNWWFGLATFGVAGIICLLLSLIGLGISTKAAMTLNKLYWILSIVSFLFFFMGMIMSIIGYAYGGTIWGLEWWTFIIYGLFAVIVALGVVTSIRNIKSCSEFVSLNDSSSKELYSSLSWYFGYLILVQFITLVWMVIRFYLLASSRK